MRKLKGINLVVASGSEKIQHCLHESFSQQGASVVLCGFLNMNFVEQLEQSVSADVILIDMDDSYEEDEDALDRLLERIDLPILFHDNNFDDLNDPTEGCGFSQQSIEKLSDKLAELAQSSSRKEASLSQSESDISFDDPETEIQLNDWAQTALDSSKVPDAERRNSLSVESVSEQKTEKHESVRAPLIEIDRDETEEHAVNVWVLGSSIGGPESLKKFLSRIPAGLPVAFVVAQHLGDGFVSLMAEQLNRISHFKIKEAVAGETLQHGEAVIVPLENCMTLSPAGLIEFTDEPWKGHYKPSIDCVIKDVTESFKTHSGVIIFSGMGADGVLACQNFFERYQGAIWAQTPDSCVISSMPDSVRKANLVSYSGSPEALALKLSVLYSNQRF